MPSLVSIKDLSFKYPKSENFALKDLSLEIEEGSFFALLGPNGAGKTTLMRLLCGRLPHYTGTLKIAPAYQNEKARNFPSGVASDELWVYGLEDLASIANENLAAREREAFACREEFSRRAERVFARL